MNKQKDIYDLKQRVYYIDKFVNTFFNKELMKLHMNMAKLNQRLMALERNNHTTSVASNESEVNALPVQTSDTKLQKANKKKQIKTATNIRTVNLG